MNAKTKIGWALAVMAFLFFNPSATCAATSSGKPPAHPCCPMTGIPDNCAESGCLCIEPKRVTPPVPLSGDQMPLVATPATGNPVVNEVAVREVPAFQPVIFARYHRFLYFHQLLI